MEGVRELWEFVERERSGTTQVLEGRGVGGGGKWVRGLMEAGLSLRG